MADGSPKSRIVRGLAKRHKIETVGGGADQWFTDPAYAAYVVRWAGIRSGDRVLDLGAGSGNLSLACLGVGASVTAVELDRNLEGLLTKRLDGRARIIMSDVFASELDALIGRVDVAIANPPWSEDFETRFLVRGLDFAPRAVGIISLDGLVGPRRFDGGWRWLRKTDQLLAPRRLSFSPNGATGQEEAVAVQVTKRVMARADGESDVVRESYYTPARRAR